MSKMIPPIPDGVYPCVVTPVGQATEDKERQENQKQQRRHNILL